MENQVGVALVSDIARDVLTEVAPDEVPIFVPASKAYFSDPSGALKQSRSKDHVLGFGMDALPIVLTPVVLHILSEVYEFLWGIAKKAVAEGLSKEISQIVRSMFRKFHSSDTDGPVVLTSEQLALIHANILTTAKKLRVPTHKAESLANSITAQLVLPKR